MFTTVDSFVSLVHLHPISHDVQVLIPVPALHWQCWYCQAVSPLPIFGQRATVPHPSYQPLIPHLVWPPLSDPWKNYTPASRCKCPPNLDDPLSPRTSHEVPQGDRCITVGIPTNG